MIPIALTIGHGKRCGTGRPARSPWRQAPGRLQMFELEAGHRSWWDYRTGAWDRDRGWRIDHIYLATS